MSTDITENHWDPFVSDILTLFKDKTVNVSSSPHIWKMHTHLDMQSFIINDVLNDYGAKFSRWQRL